LSHRLKKIKLSPPRVLALGFALIILIGAVLLSLPVSSIDGLPPTFIDALFTAASATCVTGLIVLDTSSQYSMFGQIVIIALVQLGGIGFMTAATWFAIAVKRKISLRERLILKESMNQSELHGIVSLIRRVAFYSLTIEAAGALVFAIKWSAEMPWGQAFYYGIFHSISLFNNAGFLLFPSFMPYVEDYVVNIVSILLILLGGLGFIVMAELISYPKEKKRLSLHSKIVLSMTGLLLVFGALVIFVFEFTNKMTFAPLDWDAKILASFFQSVSLRSSGTNTVDVDGLRQATQFFMILMMFIGASPGSTGGGIKITTFAILITAVYTMIRGREDVVLFRQRVNPTLVQRSITVTLLSVFMVVFASMMLAVTENLPFLSILFETTSAFGTVGLSTGITSQLTPFGKSVIVVMMFIGRIGPVTLAYALQSKIQKDLYRYPEGKIMIG